MRTDFRLEDWIVRPRRESIERGDEVVHIHPKPMQVLQCLAAAGGEVVTRDELFDAVWPGVFVTDDALTQCVVELRKAFGDSAKEQRFIKTVPKVGFCLVPPVMELTENESASSAKRKYLLIGILAVLVALFSFYTSIQLGEKTTSLPAVEGKSASIVVLPFVNMSSDPEQEYFSDGISEELLNLLAGVSKLRVISHTSAFRYKNKDVDAPTIARQLNVSHILEGSVRKSGDRVRITAQLVDAPSDTHLWSQTFDRDFGEIFAIQDEIAKHVVDEVEGSLLGDYPHSRPVDPEAYRLYLLGQYHLKIYDFPKAEAYYEQAVAVAPEYAEVYLAIASLYGARTFFGELPPREGYKRIKTQIELAQKIDEILPRTHRSAASMDFYFNWDWSNAEAALQRAVELVPGYAHIYQTYSWFLAAMGRVEEAQDEIGRGLALDPLSTSMHLTASNVYYLARMHDKAIEQCQKALDLTPNHPLALSQMGWSYLQMGRLDEAVAVMERSVEVRPGITQSLWTLGHAYAVAGKTEQAREILNRLHNLAEKRFVTPYGIALIHTGLGEKQEAMEWLEKAYDQRVGWMVYLQVEPRLDPLRSEPGFRDLLGRMDYPVLESEQVPDS